MLWCIAYIATSSEHLNLYLQEYIILHVYIYLQIRGEEKTTCHAVVRIRS
jgi:hypothetical protein